MSIGERIQKLRKQNYLSQEEMAEALDVSKQSISKWELDKALPNVEKIIKICELFEVTTDYLLTGKSEDSVDAGQKEEMEEDEVEETGMEETVSGTSAAGNEWKKLRMVYSILLAGCLLSGGLFLVIFCQFAFYYSGFAKDSGQELAFVERIYSQYTVADVMYMTSESEFVTKKVYLDTKGIREGDTVYSYVDEDGKVSFAYQTGLLARIAIITILFLAGALFLSISLFCSRKKRK